MTKSEMTELFAVMSIAWPNSELFKNGVGKLGPTISLWASCLADMDCATAQKAVAKLATECKFPPTIAEMRDAADRVGAEIRHEAERAYLTVRNRLQLMEAIGSTPDEIYMGLPSRSRKVIDVLGGMEAFIQPDKPVFNMDGFVGTYERLLRSNPARIPGAGQGMKQLAE